MIKKIRKKIILSLFLLLTITSISSAKEDSLLLPKKEIEIHNNFKINPNSNYFNLANIVDSFLSNENKIEKVEIDKKATLRKDFISATEKFNQGNALSAYSDYEKLIEKVENDVSLLNLAKVFYDIGFFSLAQKSIEKIVYKNQFYDNILELEKSYKTKVKLTQEDEIYFAKLYSSIYFDNSSQETINELNQKKNTISKNDYAQFTLARANFELKNYHHAQNAINKAINLNHDNILYQILKKDILIATKKYSEASKLIEKIKKTKPTVLFAKELEIKNEIILSNLIKNEKDKKYHLVNKTFLEGNFEKAKKDSINILNFDKNNDKITSLYAKSELALGEIERANVYFVNAYKLNKNNLETIIGLGDIRYLHGDYKNSIKTYKKAYAKDKNNYEILIKLATAQRQHAKNPKELKKLELKLDKMPKTEFIAYYKSAISIAQKNLVLKEDFLKKALNINPLYENALGELIELHLQNKNYELAKGLIYNASFTLEKNYYYYYLCGLYNQAIDNKNEAIQFYKTSLNLNPNFEVANVKLLKLIPDKLSEEI